MIKSNKSKFNKEKLLEVLTKRAEGFFYHEEVLEYGEREVKQQKRAINESNNLKSSKKLQNDVSVLLENQKGGVYSARDDKVQDEIDSPIMQDTEENYESPKNLVLLKKKVTTHYVPPDLTAVKMLLENFGEKVNNDLIDGMTDDELLSLRNEILRDIQNV